MKFTITLRDMIYEIEVAPESHEPVPTMVKVNGKELPISLSEDWEKEYPKLILIKGIPHEAEFECGEDGFPKRLWLDGTPCDVEVNFLGKSKLSKVKDPGFLTTGQANTINCPMPGKIVRILVKEGERVNAGDVCVILEAMKMENELEALKEGIVSKIHVSNNDLVDVDQILITLDDEEIISY